MAVLKIRNKYDGWQGSASSERNGLLYEVIRRRYKITKLVYVSSPGDGPEVILTSPGIPVVGDSYNLFNDSDALATCINVTPRRTNSPLLWEVDCEFDTDRLVSAATDNPLAQPADIRWQFTRYERPLIRSFDGYAAQNSAGDNYDPPITWEDTRPCVTIIRNEADFNPAVGYQYQNALNLETFATAPPLHARINNITAQQMFSNGLQYVQVTYEIELQRDGYPLLILDQGFRNAKGRLFRDLVNGQALSAPTLMNGRGFARTDAVDYLPSAIGPEDTSIDLPNFANFPPGAEEDNADGYMPSGDYYFVVKIDKELLQVTSRKPIGATVTVERGYGGTTAAAHDAGAKITLEPYFIRLIQHPVMSFEPLALPVV